MSAIQSQLREILSKHPHIHQALVFGSVATGLARYESDLDIAVEAESALSADQKMQLIESLAAATGRTIDLIDLKTVGEALLGRILRHGHRILGSNTDYAALVRRHLFEAADFLPYAERILKARRQAWTA